MTPGQFAALTLLLSVGCVALDPMGGAEVASGKGLIAASSDLEPNQLVTTGAGLAVYDPTDFIIRDRLGNDLRILGAEGPEGEACAIDVASFLTIYESAAYGSDSPDGGEPPGLDRPKWVSMLKTEEPGGGQTHCSGPCRGSTRCCQVNIGDAD